MVLVIWIACCISLGYIEGRLPVKPAPGKDGITWRFVRHVAFVNGMQGIEEFYWVLYTFLAGGGCEFYSVLYTFLIWCYTLSLFGAVHFPYWVLYTFLAGGGCVLGSSAALFLLRLALAPCPLLTLPLWSA